MKHLSGNSSSSVVKNTESLLGFCLSCFPPTVEMENYLLAWMRSQFQNEKRKKFVASFHVGKYSNLKRAPGIQQVKSEFEGRQASR